MYGEFSPTLYSQKFLLRMGEYVARNMLGRFKKINKRKSCSILLVVYIVNRCNIWGIWGLGNNIYNLMAETRKAAPWGLNGISLSSCWNTEPPCTAVAVHNLQRSMKAKVSPASKQRAVRSSTPKTVPKIVFHYSY